MRTVEEMKNVIKGIISFRIKNVSNEEIQKTTDRIIEFLMEEQIMLIIRNPVRR